jgi:hypothetical protein
MSNDTNIPTRQELLALLATSAPSGDRQINGLITNRLTCDGLYNKKTAYFYGNIGTTIKCVDGTSLLPSYSFTNDPDTGMFRNAENVIGFTAGTQTQMTISQTAISVNERISTLNGNNLILAPASGVIDFNGASIINFGGISPSPYYYDVIGVPVDIVGATTSDILVIGCPLGSALNVKVEISMISGSDTVAISLTGKVKNPAGTAIAPLPYSTYTVNADPALVAASAFFIVSGSDLVLRATGVAAITTRWVAAATITKVM